MAVSAKLYGNFIYNLALKKMDVDNDTLKVSLHTSSYTPNQDTHDFYDDVTNEVTATGYSSGGATLTTTTLAYNSSTNVISLDADDVTWTITGSMTARYAVIYDSSPGTAATNPLIGYIDFGTNETVTDGTFKLTFNASGIWNDTVA